MLKFNYKLSVKERVKAKCPRHPRYNPERDGRGGIVGTCTACYSLYDLLEARNKLDAAVREFVRRAVGCRQGTPQKEAAAARRSTGGGVTMPRRWSDVFTLISQRKAGHCGGKTTPADELTWEGTFDGQPICVVSTVRLLCGNMAHFLTHSGARIGTHDWNFL